MAQKELITKKDYAAIGEEIGLEKGNSWIKAYETAFPGQSTGFVIGRNIIERILAQPGCAGIRFHNALNQEGKKTFVYVGIDDKGNEILRHTMVTENGVIVSEDAIVADWIFWPHGAGL
jgi:hypothetical protein